MRRSLSGKLEIAIEQIKSGCAELEDVELMNKHYKKCVKMGLDADVLANYLDGAKVIKVYDSLIQNGATIRAEALLCSMDPAAVRENIAWLTNHGVKPDTILEELKDELYNLAYKPIDLAVSLLKAQANKYRVFEIIAPHLHSIADVPDKLVHDLSLLMENGIDRHRIKFWVEKYVSKDNLGKHADKFKKFGIDPEPISAKFLAEYGIKLEQ